MSSSIMSMEQVVQGIKDVYAKDLTHLPVSRDLPRLARKFTVSKYNKTDSKFCSNPFTKDKLKDKIEQVLFDLLRALTAELHSTPPAEQSSTQSKDNETSSNFNFPSQETFNTEVNLNIHETLNSFLLKYFGENDRLTRVLKSCNQSVVIATLYHVRMALKSKNIDFKDCRGEWYLDFSTGKTFTKPHISQRRREQVYKMAPDNSRLLNLYTFEWELHVEFDSLPCNSITNISVIFLGADFSNTSEADVPIAERPAIEETMRDAFNNAIISEPELDFKL